MLYRQEARLYMALQKLMYEKVVILAPATSQTCDHGSGTGSIYRGQKAHSYQPLDRHRGCSEKQQANVQPKSLCPRQDSCHAYGGLCHMVGSAIWWALSNRTDVIGTPPDPIA